MFGNRVCRVEAERVEHAVDFEARFRVATVRRSERRKRRSLHDRFLATTALTRAGRTHSARRPGDCRRHAESTSCACRCAHDWAADAIELPARRDRRADAGGDGAAPGRGRLPGLRAHDAVAAAHCWASRPATSRAICSAKAPPHAWVEALLERRARPGRGATTRPTTAARTWRLHHRRRRSRLRRRHADLRRLQRRRAPAAALEQAGRDVEVDRRGRRTGSPHDRRSARRPTRFAYDPGEFWDEMFDGPGQVRAALRAAGPRPGDAQPGRGRPPPARRRPVVPGPRASPSR